MNWLETVPRAAQGDIAAWEALYTATRREACFVALKVCGTSQDAEDLTQEAYLTAFEKLPQLQEAEKFSSWLYMIVVNKCRDYLKKKKPTLFTELQKDDAPAPDWTDDREENLPEVELDRQETVRLVAEMIDDLPEDQKLCLLLYYSHPPLFPNPSIANQNLSCCVNAVCNGPCIQPPHTLSEPPRIQRHMR